MSHILDLSGMAFADIIQGHEISIQPVVLMSFILIVHTQSMLLHSFYQNMFICSKLNDQGMLQRCSQAA